MWSKFKNIFSEICCNPGVLEIIFIFCGSKRFQWISAVGDDRIGLGGFLQVNFQGRKFHLGPHSAVLLE